MTDRRWQELCERIEGSEKVLLGVGEEFQYDWDILAHDGRYVEIEAEIQDREEYLWITPFLQKMALRQYREDKWKIAYENLRRLLIGKDYFIVSLCMDDFIYQMDFDEDRIVTPCGGFRKMQCDHNCNHELYEMPMESYDAVLRYYRKEVSLETLNEPICGRCGSKLRFNQLGVTCYAEEGYLDQWNKYTKWLQGTVNKRLCVLELGVGMEYPTVVRFPFEKIVFYNQKAFLYRIHSRLYQISEKIGDRGTGIEANAVNYFSSF